MTAQRSFPSPLAGEGAERQKREAGEGARYLTKAARKLRSQMTDAERKLWFSLKDRRFQSFKFRRQVPIGPYIADFVCFDARLIIELDGSQHADSARDKVRDKWLEDDGYRVLRFWNPDVALHRNAVIETIWHRLQVQTNPSSVSAAPSHLLPRGEKGVPTERAPK